MQQEQYMLRLMNGYLWLETFVGETNHIIMTD